MKIRQVSKSTGLTERTIRFYIEKELVQPEKSEFNGRVYIKFTAENINRLRQIATLRKMDFALDDIKQMLMNPKSIHQIIHKHLNNLQQKYSEYQEDIEALKMIAGHEFNSLKELAERLNQAAEHRQLPQADVQPRFSRFDSETEEEKNEAYLNFLVNMRLREKRDRILQPLKKSFLLLLLLLAIFALVVLVSGIPRKVDVSYPAIQMRYFGEDSAPVDVESTRIILKGKYVNRLLDNPRFSGEIIIESMPHLHDYELIDMEFGNRERGITAIITYTGIIDHKSKIETVGALTVDKNFQQLMIHILEPTGVNHKSTKGLHLLAPAETVEDAIRIYNDLMPRPQITQDN